MSETNTTPPTNPTKITADALKDILARHAKWLKGEKEGARANLSGANLSGADLSGANLSGANLKADTKFSDDTILDTGETWKEYVEQTVPQLLAAGGKAVEAGWVRQAWECHEWSNCPMHAVFDIQNESQAPALFRPRVRQFVQLFDARLLPCPFPDEPKAAEPAPA